MWTELHAAIPRLIQWLEAGGPWLFFGAMALLPAVGMPMLAFSLTAGPAFGPTMGMGGVVAAGLAAATFNMLLTYFLARRALRPLIENLMRRLGHRLPETPAGDMTDLTVILRVTPGIPFFVQNYLLGLANVPVGKYVVISCLASWTYLAGFILFGDALLHGRGKGICLAASVLVAAFAVTHLARRHFLGKNPPMSLREELPLGQPAETVSEFTRRVKECLERNLRTAWVRGEVSNVRAQPSGHWYFSLKDAGAQVRAVMFRGDAARSRVALRDGMQVVVYGEISVYEARGEYQLIVRTLTDDGVGRLQRDFEALKQKLAAEGLFAAEKKRPLPRLPAAVGFITSPAGAAVQDFLRILRRREWRGRVVVLPARVQGDGAAEEMIAMLQWAAAAEQFDLLVIGRGGGSAEDLWAFNHEGLVRAVAASPVPIISAVGHEIDFTSSDFAADVRAETPSAAAELISSHFVACLERSQRAGQRLNAFCEDALRTARRHVDHARTRLKLLAPAAQLERGWLRLDDLTNRRLAALRAGAQLARQRLGQVQARLQAASPVNRMAFERQRLESLGKRLEAASPQSILGRGYVLMRDQDGVPVTSRQEALTRERFRAQFGDGEVPLILDGAKRKTRSQ